LGLYPDYLIDETQEWSAPLSKAWRAARALATLGAINDVLGTPTWQ